ncbi:MAG: histidine kinase [Endomicrobiales bacterium]|jgi:hypothetical protein
MPSYLEPITKSAKDLSKNPLGIIALFIILVYGFACLLFGLSAEHLASSERAPLIWFTVLFPCIVLFVFFWLVAKHNDKLYSPEDYRTDESFLETLKQNVPSNKYNLNGNRKEVEQLLDVGKEFKIIKDQEKRIENDLTNRKLDTGGDTVKVLIHHLAASQVYTWFAGIYNTIFGSQITLLKMLRDAGNGMAYDNIKEYFETVKKNNPNQLGVWTTNNYLAFLFRSELINLNNNVLSITDTGKDFLGLLSQSRYPENKAL